MYYNLFLSFFERWQVIQRAFVEDLMPTLRCCVKVDPQFLLLQRISLARELYPLYIHRAIMNNVEGNVELEEQSNLQGIAGKKKNKHHQHLCFTCSLIFFCNWSQNKLPNPVTCFSRSIAASESGL